MVWYKFKEVYGWILNIYDCVKLFDLKFGLELIGLNVNYIFFMCKDVFLYGIKIIILKLVYIFYYK